MSKVHVSSVEIIALQKLHSRLCPVTAICKLIAASVMSCNR